MNVEQLIHRLQDAARLGIGVKLHPAEIELLVETFRCHEKELENERQVRTQTETILAATDGKLTEARAQVNELRSKYHRLKGENARRSQVLERLGVRA